MLSIDLSRKNFQDYLNNKIDFTEDNESEARWRRFAFQSFIFFVLIGIPLWWIATTPYRAKLPQLEPQILQNLEENLDAFFNTNRTGVWDNLELHSDYNLHFIFIHNELGPTNIDGIAASKIILNKMIAFSQKYFQPIGMKMSISSEHIWDFNLANFLLNFGPDIHSIDESSGNIPSAVATELDRISSPPVDKDPLLKISIFFDKEGNLIKIRQNHEERDGIAIASWGGLFFYNEAEGNDPTSLLNAIMAVLQLQFSILSTKEGKKETIEMALKLHQKRLCLQNLLQTAQILNSLHELASKIEDLVISDEVAEYAEQSRIKFFKAYDQFTQNGKFDSESAAQARRLAEFANSHHSLLELLNFPSDQKYGIYVPLFLPLLAPILQPLALFLLFLIAKFKEMKRPKQDENSEKND